MTYQEYNAFCARRPAATHVAPWGASHVWKAGGKVFRDGDELRELIVASRRPRSRSVHLKKTGARQSLLFDFRL